MQHWSLHRLGYRWLLPLLTLLVSGCATVQAPQGNQVKIAPNTVVTLPTPCAIGLFTHRQSVDHRNMATNKPSITGAITSYSTSISTGGVFIMGLTDPQLRLYPSAYNHLCDVRLRFNITRT